MTKARSANGSHSPSRQVLRQLPERALVLLMGIGGNATIRAVMVAGGYSAEHHKRGQRLIEILSDYGTGGVNAIDDEPGRQARQELGDWARTHMRRLRFGVEHLHPEHEGLFEGIDATNVDAVFAVAKLLTRMEAIEAAAPEVHNTLEERGLHARERSRLRELIDCAQRVVPPAVEEDPERRAEARRQLYSWYTDWGHTAKTLIRRRDVLISLGLAGRVRRRGIPEGEGE